MVELTAKRPADWISPALLERLTHILQPIEVRTIDVQQHEILIDVGYNKALTDVRNVLKYRDNINIPVSK